MWHFFVWSETSALFDPVNELDNKNIMKSFLYIIHINFIMFEHFFGFISYLIIYDTEYSARITFDYRHCTIYLSL